VNLVNTVAPQNKRRIIREFQAPVNTHLNSSCTASSTHTPKLYQKVIEGVKSFFEPQWHFCIEINCINKMVIIADCKHLGIHSG
jgi:hypothetical protein